jgi:hypothetical protein
MFEKKSRKFEVNYLYQNDPRAEIFDSEQDSLSQGTAARRLIELHQGDAENSLAMPDADADEAQLLEQASLLGITDIRVTRLVHEHQPGKTPGHYQQP